MVSLESLVYLLVNKRGYLKWGAEAVSELFGTPLDVSKEALKIAKEQVKNELLSTAKKDKRIKRLFFDIETSPNVMISWRAGYKLNLGPENILQERAIICICWKWEGEEQVNYLTWDNNQCDKEMLQLFVDELQSADEVIGHNGDRFDIPWIRTRCLYHRIPLLPEIKSLDTLKKVKSRFLLNSNKLDYLGQFLGVGEKIKTGGLELWKRICFDKDPKALKEMVDYCVQDVSLLEKVYHEIDNYIKPNTHVGALLDKNVASCPGCGSTNHRKIKEIATATGTINHQLQCTDCNKYYKVNNTNYKKLTNG